MRYFLFLTRWVINSILSALLGYKLVGLALTFNQTPVIQTVTTTPVASMIEQTVSTASAYDLATLLEAHWFGDPREQMVSPQSVTAPPPKTKLDLKLYGIYYSTHPTASIAMIATETGESKLYRKYDTLPGGGTLYQIHPKEVILLRNNRQETLLLINNQTHSKTPPSEVPTPHAVSSAPEQPTQSPEQLLGEYQEKLRTNPQQLRNLFNVTPYSQNGQFIGYRLNTGQNAALMTTFNLQAGDILTEVNGVVFNSPLKGLEVIQQLATAGQINATVLRNGQPLSLSFNVEK